MATGTVNLPAGYQLEAPQVPPTTGGASLPPGYQLEDVSAAAPVSAGGGAPLTEQDAKQDQANPSGSYAASQAHINNAPAKDPDHVRFKASDGSVHDVPKEHLTKAMQIDPKLKIIDWPTVPMSKAAQTVAQIDENVTHPDTKAMGAYARMGEEEEQKTGAPPAVKGMLAVGSGGAAADLVGAGGVAGAIGKTIAEGVGSAAGDAAGQAISDGKIDPTEVAVSGALGAGGRAIGETASGVKSLISGGSKDVTEQGLKDMIKTASGSKDPDVIDAIHEVVDKPKMFSTVENELKLAKPKLEAMKDEANNQLKALRETSTGTIQGAKTSTHVMFDDLIDKAHDVLESDKVKDGIYEIRDFVGPKLKNEDMTFKELNDVKDKIDKEVKKWDVKPGQTTVVNTIDKAKQDALHAARDFVQSLENKAEPAAGPLNNRVHTLINTTEALGKQFENLDTPEKAKLSYEAGKATAKKDAAIKAGGLMLGGSAGAATVAGAKMGIEKMLDR